MKKYNEIEGDLIELAKQGNFDVIAHGCNCFCNMGAGIAPLMAEAFGCNNYFLEDGDYRGDINKLGQIQYEYYRPNFPDTKGSFAVVNAYTQYSYGKNHTEGISVPLDYEALTLCLRKINHEFKGKHIGLPLIGCGLAGGIWDINLLTEEKLKEITFDLNSYKDVKTIIQEELKDCNVTIVFYNKNK